ncbi:MAG: ABC transporter substrate binding protein, partial [Pseudolabrys sp.]
MRQREFIFLVSGAATMWSMRARAQQSERIRLIGVLQGVPADDQQGKVRFAAFQQALQQFGWTVGRNVRFDHRWGEGDAVLIRQLRQQAVELATLAPDVIFTTGTEQTIQATRTVPIVFAVVADPVGAGMVARLSRPGGNAT